MDWLDKELLLPLVIATGIIIGGARFLNAKNASLVTRVALGVTLLGAGVGCGYYLIYVAEDLQKYPWLLGFGAGAAGLGINQVAAPLRVAAGGAA